MEPACLATGPVPWVSFAVRGCRRRLYSAGVTFTLRGAADVDLVAVCKDVSFDQVAYIQGSAIVQSRDSLQHLLHGYVCSLRSDPEGVCLRVFLLVTSPKPICTWLRNRRFRLSFSERRHKGQSSTTVTGMNLPFLVKKLCHSQLCCLRCIFALYIPPIGYWLAALCWPQTLPLQTSLSSCSEQRRKTWNSGFPEISGGKLRIKALLRFLRLQGAQDS